MVLKVRMEPSPEALVTGKDHKSERPTGDVRLRQQNGNVPDPAFDRIIISHFDTGRPGMLNAFQQLVDPAPPDSNGFYHLNTEDP